MSGRDDEDFTFNCYIFFVVVCLAQSYWGSFVNDGKAIDLLKKDCSKLKIDFQFKISKLIKFPETFNRSDIIHKRPRMKSIINH